MAGNELEQVDFAENPEPRCAVILLLDTSGSMAGVSIQALNEGLKVFEREVKADHLAALRAEICPVTFGGWVSVIDPTSGNRIGYDARIAFATADQFCAPTLSANGGTPLGDGARTALKLLRERKDLYKQGGLDYFRPWVLILTDGEPTDSGWEAAAEEMARAEERKEMVVFPIGVEGANLTKLARFSRQHEPLMLKGLAYDKLFVWLSKSMTAVSNSNPGQQVPLPRVDSWAAVSTSN